MTEKRWQHITRLFTQALEVEKSVRDTWLQQVCGDDDGLLKEVQSLLDAHSADDPLKKPMDNLNELVFSTLEEKFLKESSFGKYKIEDRIGAGGMGLVYKARDTRLNRTVAIKLLPLAMSLNENAKKRFLNEARLAATLDDPNVCTIYETGETDDGTLYIVMRYYEGKTLRKLLAHGSLSQEKSIEFAIQTAKGLSAAHKEGMIHRDIKPANLIITENGKVKILDFGIAKIADAELTKTGQRPGTTAYMAPEQVKGEEIGPQADIWAVGVLLYEMISGKRPFSGDTATSLMYKIINEKHTPLDDLNPNISNDLVRITNRALSKDPSFRFASTGELLVELEAVQKRLNGFESEKPVFQILKENFRKPKIALSASLALAIIAIAAFWFLNRQAEIRWAQTEAPAEIEALISDNRYTAAFSLIGEALDIVPNDPSLGLLFESISAPVNVDSDPQAARFFYKPYSEPDALWIKAGITPMEGLPLPRQHLYWRMEMDGHVPVEGSFSTLWRTLEAKLHPDEENVDGMVWIPEGTIQIGEKNADLDDFWLDKYEVTNREFARFVASGGYENEEYWQKALKESDMTWDEARQMFRDKTGRPGPADWKLGMPPDGLGDYPVGGISWYEAAAYCNFVDKSLPTIYHWRRATGLNREIYTDIHRMSNFSGKGPAPPGAYHGISRYGAYDMAGNQKEWVWNATGDRRYILGGSWDESSKMYQGNDASLPEERGETYGVRCALYGEPLIDEFLEPAEITYVDFSGHEPVDDEIFEIFKRIYQYRPGPLDVSEKKVFESQHWRRETVTFNAAYDNERVKLHLFIPHGVSPPYQTVIHFPGSYALAYGSSDFPTDLAMFDFIIRSGRILAYPVYQRTYERYDPEQTVFRRFIYPQWSHDLGRTLDYLETRTDIDHTSVAFLGFSLGGEPGPIFGAIHDRLSSMILLGSGLSGSMLNWDPELFPLNFAPRVNIPVMLISGEDDVLLGPPEKGREPLLDLFGTPDEHKRLVLLEGSHIPDDWSEFIRETLDWLDRYQGPVISKHPQ